MESEKIFILFQAIFNEKAFIRLQTPFNDFPLKGRVIFLLPQ